MALDMAKFLARFVEEARDHVSRLNEGLVRLENHPDDAETINAVFRSAHTIKGSSRMMKLTAITEVAHKLEDALGALREKKIAHTRGLADVLFQGSDCIAGMVEKVAAGQDIVADTAALCEQLAKAAEGQAAPALAPDVVPAQEPVPPATEPAAAAENAPAASGAGDRNNANPPGKDLPRTHAHARSDSIRVNADKLDELIRLMGEIISHQNRLKHRLSDVKGLEKTAKKAVELMASCESCHALPDGAGRSVFESGQALQLRLKQLAAHMRDDATMQELLTMQLQEKALMLRMVPLSSVFDSLHRMVRDVAHSQGKDVELLIEGGDIGLDKKMIEKIGDPLVHMLRNAVDHGIESPEERKRAGKSEQGNLHLSASYDAGSVLIVLRDDGGGIPLDKVREKALRKKMFSEAELGAMAESEVIDLIFHPGFSTSAMITDISGRGVGMDVVKRNVVEELRGTIAITTRAGHGTTISVRLPMTLAVMRVLLVEAAGMTFAVTAQYVSEIIRVPGSEVIAVLSRKAIRLREELIPVADLEALLKLPAGSRAKKSNPLILLVRTGNEKLGLIVDALLDEEDMVIKALPGHMKNLPLVAGVTISGKNEIVNILHVPGLITAAGDLRAARPAETGRAGATRILVVDDSLNTREIEKSILEAYGYAVDLAEDGMEAIEKAQAVSYDLVITDVEMPRLDGFSLTERLRREGAYTDTPIIIMTSREKEEDKRRGIQVGANAYIVKGAFDQTNLLDTVRNLIG